MEQNQLKKIKDKLRKLMNHEASARDLGNIDEANTFAAKISSLLLEYQIEVHEMEEHNLGKTETVEKETVDVGEMTNRHESDWIVHLYHQIALNNFCQVIIRHKSKGFINIWLIGEPMNKEVVHYICAQLMAKFRELARSSFKTYKGPEKRNTYIRGFLRGATIGVGQKLKEERITREQENQVHGLVVAQKEKVKKYVANEFGALGQSRSKNMRSADGRTNGVTAGRNVNINKGVGGSRGGQSKLN